jgi:ApbE superfamily uncharacterized protein (UPF0280 family)
MRAVRARLPAARDGTALLGMYEPRTYRHSIKDTGLVSFTAVVRETDLYIRARSDLKEQALEAIHRYRRPLEDYILSNPLFMHSLEPVPVEKDAPEIVRMMADASRQAGVGPMASVAGAFAELVGKELLKYSGEIIVENGGDIFMQVAGRRVIGIYAGDSPLSSRLGIEIKPDRCPLGVCTSSGTVGPSLSLGLADAVVVLSRSTALADAAATAIGNRVKAAGDISTAIEHGQKIGGLSGIVIIAGDKMGAWGDVDLIEL